MLGHIGIIAPWTRTLGTAATDSPREKTLRNIWNNWSLLHKPDSTIDWIFTNPSPSHGERDPYILLNPQNEDGDLHCFLPTYEVRNVCIPLQSHKRGDSCIPIYSHRDGEIQVPFYSPIKMAIHSSFFTTIERRQAFRHLSAFFRNRNPHILLQLLEKEIHPFFCT